MSLVWKLKIFGDCLASNFKTDMSYYTIVYESCLKARNFRGWSCLDVPGCLTISRLLSQVDHIWLLSQIDISDCYYKLTISVFKWSDLVTFLKERKFLTSGHEQAEKLVPHLASFDWQSMQEDSWDGLKIFTKTTSHMGLWLNV